MQVKRLMITGLIAAVAVATVVTVGVVRVVSADGNTGGGQPAHADAGVPRYQHIFVIMMENHSFDEIIGNPNAPQINALAQEYGLATNSYGVTHPSEPNYVAAIGGNFFGIQDDAPYTSHTLADPSLASQLEAAGLTWKDYQQALPYPGFLGTTYPSPTDPLYASKHNPFLNFASVQNSPAELQKIVPDTQLATDLQGDNVPTFGFIAPDQCHDMHGIKAVCSDSTTLFQQGDAYVASTVSAITSARFWQRGNNAIVVTWDEDDFSPTNLGCCDANPGGGQVATIVITSQGPHGLRDNTPFNHYSLLQTIQDAFHLGCLQFTCDTANVTPMAKLFGGDE